MRENTSLERNFTFNDYREEIQCLLLNLKANEAELSNNPGYIDLLRQLRGTLEVIEAQPGINPDMKFLKFAKQRAADLIFSIETGNAVN